MNQDKNIPSDEDEIIDVDTTSQMLQASNILDNFYNARKCKVMLVTTIEWYNLLLITYELFRKQLAKNKMSLLNPNNKLL